MIDWMVWRIHPDWLAYGGLRSLTMEELSLGTDLVGALAIHSKTNTRDPLKVKSEAYYYDCNFRDQTDEDFPEGPKYVLGEADGTH